MSARRLLAATKWPALTALGTFVLVLAMTGSFPYSVADTWQRAEYLIEEAQSSSDNSALYLRDETEQRWTRTRDFDEIEWQSPPLPRRIDRDCGDFKTRREAQRFFNAAGRGDPHRLDADNDGQACELLP
jgi:hypothetical protein